MDKKTTNEVMELYAECLRHLYKIANLDIPEEFDPIMEAGRLTGAVYDNINVRLSFIDRALQITPNLSQSDREKTAMELYENYILPNLERIVRD